MVLGAAGGAIGAVGSTAGALGNVFSLGFGLMTLAPKAFKFAKKAKEAYDQYQKYKGKWHSAMDSMSDMASKIPPSVAAKDNTRNLDWDGVPPKPIWDFKKASPHAWATRAVEANVRAARAAREAQDDLAEAAHHEEVAREAAREAEQVILKAQQDAWLNAVRSPSVQPFIHYCNHLAKVVAEDPAHAREPATMDLRRFCQGFQEDLQSIVEAPEVHGSHAEQRLFDSPPQDFVREPHWGPHSPAFQPPKLDVDHRLAVEACLPAAAAGLAPVRCSSTRRGPRPSDFL